MPTYYPNDWNPQPDSDWPMRLLTVLIPAAALTWTIIMILFFRSQP